MRARRLIENALDWLRFDLPARFDRRALIAAGVVLAAALIALIVVIDPFGGGGKGETRVVTVAVSTDNAQEAPVGTLGFPLVATRNTTRISGPDPTTDAAAAALATHPPVPGAKPLEAAILVPDDDWQAGIAASVLAGPPLRAPVLLSARTGVPDATAEALSELQPRGGGGAGDAAVYLAGGAAAPPDLRAERIDGSSPAEIANSIDELRQRLLKTDPDHILVASSDQPAYAMPAAAWAARSGDPVLFSGQDEVPDATLEALRRHHGTAAYILGPESAISKSAEQQIDRVAGSSTRIGAQGPVQNSLLFARYSDSTFGWNINDPGHGIVLASTERPLDAAAASSLASSANWGPLLLLDTPDALPPELRSFLLDIKPGYESDPTRAIYNHIWLMGDASAIGGEVQAEVDELAEVAPIGGTSGAGGAPGTAPGQGAPDNESEPAAPRKGKP
jgi:hypothetical protein